MAGTVLIVDDDRNLAELVERVLTADGFDCIIATDGESGLRIAREHEPDLVILDIGLPGLDGLEVCRRLRGDPLRARLPIILLSAHASESDRVMGLELGADDYVIKPFGSRELIARVHAVLRRANGSHATPAVLRRGSLRIALHAHKVSYAGKPVTLTAGELRILELLAGEPGRVFSRDEIIDAALHHDAAVTPRTVDTHIASIRKKLGRGADYIQTVRSFGYMFHASNGEA